MGGNVSPRRGETARGKLRDAFFNLIPGPRGANKVSPLSEKFQASRLRAAGVKLAIRSPERALPEKRSWEDRLTLPPWNESRVREKRFCFYLLGRGAFKARRR